MRFVLHFDSISISISISISLLFYSTMPTIAGPSSSPHKHIVAARSENTGVPEVNTPRKRKLRSDSAAEVASTVVVTESSFSTPMKRKSPRRCAVSYPRTLKEVIQWAPSSYPFDLCLAIRICVIVRGSTQLLIIRLICRRMRKILKENWRVQWYQRWKTDLIV